MLAPRIAKEVPDVAGLIVLAVGNRGLEDAMIEQSFRAKDTALKVCLRKTFSLGTEKTSHGDREQVATES